MTDIKERGQSVTSHLPVKRWQWWSLLALVGAVVLVLTRYHVQECRMVTTGDFATLRAQAQCIVLDRWTGNIELRRS